MTSEADKLLRLENITLVKRAQEALKNPNTECFEVATLKLLETMRDFFGPRGWILETFEDNLSPTGIIYRFNRPKRSILPSEKT